MKKVKIIVMSYLCMALINQACAKELLQAPLMLEPADKSVLVGPPTFNAEAGSFDSSLVPNEIVYLVSDKSSNIGKGEHPTSFEPGKTYYWRADAILRDDRGVPVTIAKNKKIFSFKIAMPGAVQTTIHGTDAEGREIGECDDIVFYQGMKSNLFCDTASETNGITYSVVGGKLPTGLKLDRKTGIITGVATTSSTNSVVIQAKVRNDGGATVTRRIVVKPLGAIAGKTFQGFASCIPARKDVAHEKFASVSMTIGKTGAISAKVVTAGKTYNFKGTGFDAINDDRFESTLYSSVKIGKTYVTNSFNVSIPYVNAIEGLPLSASANATIKLSVKDDKTHEFHTNTYDSELFCDYRKEKKLLPLFSEWQGYYTVALPQDGAFDGIPQGSGYLTLTIDKNANVKVSGVLGDGAAVSFSTLPVLSGKDLSLPIYYGKGRSVLAGMLRIVMRDNEGDFDGGLLLIDSDSKLIHRNNEPNSNFMKSADGFELTLTPVGGFYDKTHTLRQYYLGKSATLGGEDYSFVLAKNLELNGLSIKYTRTTGIFNGTFNAIKEQSTQESVSNKQTKERINYAGVIIFDELGALSAHGFFKNQLPRADKSKWTATWPLFIAEEGGVE